MAIQCAKCGKTPGTYGEAGLGWVCRDCKNQWLEYKRANTEHELREYEAAYTAYVNACAAYNNRCRETAEAFIKKP